MLKENWKGFFKYYFETSNWRVYFHNSYCFRDPYNDKMNEVVNFKSTVNKKKTKWVSFY